MQRRFLSAFLIILLYSLALFLSVSVASAEEFNSLDQSELIVLEQAQLLDSGDIISGYSHHESPFFKYRVESHNELGYSFGASVDVFSDSMNLTESGEFWYWELSIEFSQGECSCRIHISQIDYAFQVLASTTISAWHSDESSTEDSLLIPIVIPHSNDFSDVDSRLQFSSEINFLADVYFHPLDYTDFEDTLDEFTTASIFDYTSAELSYIDREVEMELLPLTSADVPGTQIMFSLQLNNLSDGFYWVEFNEGIFSTWNLKYFFEIDLTEPVVVIDGITSVDEGLEWVVIDATSSYDPVLEYDDSGFRKITIVWMFEDPDGALQVPSESMILSDSQVQFLPIISGEYKFTALIRDNAGNENQSTHIITVQNVVPQAIICDKIGEIIDYETLNYNLSNKNELFLSAEMSFDSHNDLDGLQYGWYLDGLLHSSNNTTIIYLNDLNNIVELELVVKDSDGDSNRFKLILNKLNANDVVENDLKSDNSNFFNGLNLVLLTALFCTLVLLIVKRKSSEVDPLPKWSKHNKKQ